VREGERERGEQDLAMLARRRGKRRERGGEREGERERGEQVLAMLARRREEEVRGAGRGKEAGSEGRTGKEGW
jgi:hypothetical protein